MFKIPRSHLKILGVRWFHIEDPKLLGVGKQNFVPGNCAPPVYIIVLFENPGR
jgi:hypothetical protein